VIEQYRGVSPKGDLILLQKLGEKLSGKSFLHVNSTKAGGGVAEILHRMIPIISSLGISARWEVIDGDAPFFDMTKKLHNSLQGRQEKITDEMWDHHYEINRDNAAKLDLEADAVLIHDPQPVALADFRKSGVWMWRCHIDLSSPWKGIWERLNLHCVKYDAAIFSVARFAQSMPIDKFIIPPSIDPLSDKNCDLTESEIGNTLTRYGIPTDRPLILQVSRFDRFKDPVGVIEAFRMVRKYNDCILVLAGSPADDDPEGEVVLNEVLNHANGDPDIFALLIPAFSDRDINALQRAATVILQKSLKEGFGLTVTEAMWKGKPVIGGATGGIPLQIDHGANGFLVYSVEGAAFRIRQLLNDPARAAAMGRLAKEHVRNNFLITRQARDYLSCWHALQNNGRHLLEI